MADDDDRIECGQAVRLPEWVSDLGLLESNDLKLVDLTRIELVTS